MSQSKTEAIERILNQIESYPHPTPEGMVPAFDYQIREARAELAALKGGAGQEIEADFRRAVESIRACCAWLMSKGQTNLAVELATKMGVSDVGIHKV